VARTLEQIVASHQITREELDALMRRFDANGDGQLQGEEIRSFAKEIAPLVESTLDDIVAILDFYQLDDDPSLSADELKDFLQIQI
jgi:Ca2+-binding EF-hand superfamily protein